MNLRPPGYEPGELPSCSTPRRVSHGFEEPVLGMTRGYVTDPAEAKSGPTGRPRGGGQPVGDAVVDGLGEGVADPLGDEVGVGAPATSWGAIACAFLIAASSRFWAVP